MLSSFDAVFYTLAFIVPGFLCDSVLNVMVRRKTLAYERSLLRFLALSCVNYAIWSWLIILIVKSSFFVGRPLLEALGWGLIILVSPVVLGVVLGALSQRNTIRTLLERYGVYTVHPIPTAWDYFFSTTGPVWVLVTLREGHRVAGRFGTRPLRRPSPRSVTYTSKACFESRSTDLGRKPR